MVGGAVRCWGNNDSGQLGQGHTTNIGDDPNEPAVTVPLGGPAVQIAAGISHVCALMQSGEVLCWGDGGWGQLGLGDPFDVGDDPGEMPPPAVAVGNQSVSSSVCSQSPSSVVNEIDAENSPAHWYMLRS